MNDYKNLYEEIKIKKTDSNKTIIICDRNKFDSTIRGCLAAKIIQEYTNANVLVLTDIIGDNKNKKIFNKFGIFDLINSFEKKDIFKNFYFFLMSLIIYLNILFKSFFNKNKTLDNLIKNFKISEINVGDLIYDSHIRKNHKYLNFSFLNYDFLKKFIVVYYRIKKIKKIIREKDVVAVIVGGKHYINAGNLFLRCASKNNINTFVISYKFFKKINNYSDVLRSTHYITKKELIETKKNKIKLVKKFIKNRFIKKIHGNFVAKETFKKVYGQNIKNVTKKNLLEKILNKKFDNKKLSEFKINLYALNAFSDSPRGGYISGKFLFIDYYDAFKKTVEKILTFENNKTIWLIKPHPASKNYLEDGIVENYINQLESKNIFLCPDYINNLNLFKIIDNLVTPRSTIGLEYACFGKMPLFSCSNSISHLGFAKVPSSVENYFREIKKESFSKKLKTKQIQNAQTSLYLLEKFKNSQLPASAILPELNLSQIIDEASDFDDYFLKISKNLKANKLKKFEDDIYFKNLKSEILKDYLK